MIFFFETGNISFLFYGINGNYVLTGWVGGWVGVGGGVEGGMTAWIWRDIILKEDS